MVTREVRSTQANMGPNTPFFAGPTSPKRTAEADSVDRIAHLPRHQTAVDMSLAIVRTRGLAGMYAPQVTVEVHLANGLPSFTLVGLPDAEVRESRERVRAALQTSRFDFPSRRITVNLAPADLPKESGRFDLPIALGILAATGQMPMRTLDQYEFVGELSLTGELRPVRGTLAMAFAVARSEHSTGPTPRLRCP